MKKILFTLIAVLSLTALIGCGSQEVTVTFHENGGADLADLTVVQEETITEPTIAKEGYTFEGWYEDAEFSTAFDFSTLVVRNIDLYAKWSINSYTLTFEFGNGDEDYTFSDEYNVLITYPIDPTRTGYEFGGWYSDSEFTTEFNSTRVPSSDMTLYAYWIQNQYTVNFYIDSNTEPTYTEEVYYGEAVANAPALPVVTGYDSAWSEDITNITSDLDVYVVNTKQVFNITFKDFEGTTYNTLSVEYGDLITPTTTPSRVGYDFIGYYSEALERNVDLTTYTVTSDLVLQDAFLIQSFTVMFFGGEANALLGAVQYVDYGTSALAPTEGLDKTGYTFTGWDVEFDSVTEDLNVYAVYTVNQYDAIFNANSGVYADESSVITVTEDYNANITVPEVPIKAGYVFEGWFTDTTYETEIYFGTGVTLPVGGFTVYAKWTELVGTTYTVSGTYYFEEVEIAADQLSINDSVYTQTSFETYTPFVNIYYDTNMSAVRDIEGYEFYKYVIDGVDYFDKTELINITEDTTVDVYYRRTVVTVSFTDEVLGEDVTTRYYTYYNGSILNPPTPTAVTGMTVVWEIQNFENVKSNLNVQAIQYDNSLQTVIFMSNGTIIYMSTNESELGEEIDPHAVVLTVDSPLWNMDQSGYRFLGWFIQGTNTQVVLDDLYFDDEYFTSANITTVEARWVELTSLNEAEDISMTVDTETDTITIEFSNAPVTVTDTDVYPTDFTFILNGEYITSSLVTSDSLMNYINQTEDNFTLTLTSTDAYYDYFRDLLLSADTNYDALIVGTHTLQIIAVGDDYEVVSSDTSAVYQYKVESIYEGIPESSQIKDYYIIEDFGSGTLRYVFYSNLTYQFEGLTFTIEEGSNHITADGNKLSTTDIPGEFVFTITDSEGTRTYYGLVVKDIRQFDIGSSYQNYLTEINASLEDDQFLNEATDFTYNVGASNGFYLDILITDNNGSKIDLSDVLLNYEFYLNDATVALDETTVANYVTIVDNVLYFTNLAVGNDFKIVVEPKYEASLMDMDALEYNISVNDGYNAFTNEELKALYGDLDVSYINIHRDIEASLEENQLYEDGSPINEFAHPYDDYDEIGNVYYRLDSSTDDDQITIEGNFMTIDASDIACINAENEGFGIIEYAQGFDIVSTQIGIFYYNVYESSPVNNNQFTMNNLKIVGNTTTPSVNYSGTEEEIYTQERLMSQNSGGMLGVVIRNGEADLNNLVIGYTVIGVTTNAYGENDAEEAMIVDLDYVEIYDSWANSVYLYAGSGVSLENCNIGSSGGAAIHFEDTHSGTEAYDNPQLIISETTEINNWISGQESWFKAYGMSSVALALKSNINNSISTLGKTIIQIQENPVTGLETEMMNFVFLSLPMSGANTEDENTNTITGSEVILDITDEVDQTVVERDWNFTEQLWPLSATLSIIDPRVSEDGQYGFALGDLSGTYAFLQMISDIQDAYKAATGGGELSDTDAGNLATIAGFYDLTAEEAVQVAGTMAYGATIQQAVATVKGTPDYATPQYIEVVSPIKLTGADGNATILIEMFNTTED